MFIVEPCILITLKFLSLTNAKNAFVGDKNFNLKNYPKAPVYKSLQVSFYSFAVF
jgi:hypothetical protein